MKKIIRSLSERSSYSKLDRLSIPNLKVKINNQSNLKDVSAKLFGEKQISNQISSQTTPNPLAIFCTKNTENDIIGDTVEGFSNVVFCNKTNHVQTDVGICNANDAVQYWDKGKILVHMTDSKVEEDLRNAEHLILLSVDNFENPSSFTVWFIKILISYIYSNCIYLFRQ